MKKPKKLTTVCIIVTLLLLLCFGQGFAASCGDVNSSGSVDIVDALLIAQYYVGLNPPNFDPAFADVNSSGSVDIVDALLISQYYVGLIAQLSCPSTPTTAPTAEPTAEPTASPGGITKIMPLGDSITDGNQTPGGYRIKLWSDIQNIGKTIDFVGSLQNGPTELPDKNHEGHSGWRIDQLDSNINGWMDSYKPGIVLLHIGTNDITQNYDLANAPSRVGGLLDKILAKLPSGGKVYVAKVIPISYASGDQSAVNFNNQIAVIVQTRQSAGKPVYIVDMHSALTTADLADQVHPNRGGYDKMADVWFAAIRNDL
jgi:lysophospholipase L1-like esterase